MRLCYAADAADHKVRSSTCSVPGLLALAGVALTVAERVLPERAHKFAPKRCTQPHLFASLIVKEYPRVDYRSAEEMIGLSDSLGGVLRLRHAPDCSTLWRFAQAKVTPKLIEQRGTSAGQRA